MNPNLDALQVLPSVTTGIRRYARCNDLPPSRPPALPPCFPLFLWLQVPLVYSLPHLHIGHRAGLWQSRWLSTQLTVAPATWWRTRASHRCWTTGSERRRVSGTLLSRWGQCTHSVDASPEIAPRLARCPRIGNPAKQHQRTAQRGHISHFEVRLVHNRMHAVWNTWGDESEGWAFKVRTHPALETVALALQPISRLNDPRAY